MRTKRVFDVLKALISCLILSGCGSGQYVVTKSVSDYNCSKSTTYYCKYDPWFFLAMSSNLKICDNVQDCNDYCEKLRQEK